MKKFLIIIAVGTFIYSISTPYPMVVFAYITIKLFADPNGKTAIRTEQFESEMMNILTKKFQMVQAQDITNVFIILISLIAFTICASFFTWFYYRQKRLSVINSKSSKDTISVPTSNIVNNGKPDPPLDLKSF